MVKKSLAYRLKYTQGKITIFCYMLYICYTSWNTLCEYELTASQKSGPMKIL